jgi:hypothetical protein
VKSVFISQSKEREVAYFHLSIFVAAMGSGVASIISLKALGFGQLIVTAMPLTIMTIYMFSAIFFRKLRVRLDQVGDNMYYMGFIYTLTSLGVSLFQLANFEDVASAIVENFGIALTTTVYGIAARVVLVQMRGDPLETERQARLELADTSRELRSQLQASALEFSNFRRQLQQSLQNYHEETVQSSKHIVDQTFENLENVVQNTSESIEKSYGVLAEKTKDIGNISGEIVKALSDLSIRVTQVNIPTDLIERQLRATVDEIKRGADTLFQIMSEESERREDWKKSVEALSNLSEAIHTYWERASEESKDTLKGHASLMDGLVRRIGGVVTDMEKAAAATARLGNHPADRFAGPTSYQRGDEFGAATRPRDEDANFGPANRTFGSGSHAPPVAPARDVTQAADDTEMPDRSNAWSDTERPRDSYLVPTRPTSSNESPGLGQERETEDPRENEAAERPSLLLRVFRRGRR